jgi:hypothetical protein
VTARLALVAATTLSLVATTTVPARAQAPSPRGTQPEASDTRALAEMLFFTARGLIEAGRYAEACGKLTESYRLDPAAGTLLNLAVCNEKLGKIASAWGELRDAESEARRMNRPDRVQLASERIQAIEPELPFLAINVPAAVRAIPGLEITRNGIPIQGAAWDTELPVDPGDVEVGERAPGYKPQTLHVTVVNRQHAALAAVPLELAPVERAAVPFWTGRRTAGALMIAGGIGAAAVGTVFGLQAENDKKSSDSNCPTYYGDLRCNQTGVSDMSSARTAAWISDAGLGLGAIGVLAGAYFLATTGGQERTAGSATGWSWGVGGGPRAAGGRVALSF